MRTVSVILMTIGLAILGWVNATVGVVCLFGGAALWVVWQKKTVLVLERAIASKSRRQALDQQAEKKKHVCEQFAGLSAAEKEAVKYVRLNGHILPGLIASHLANQGFADPAGIVDKVRSKTPFLLGSFSGEFSINPELKELLDELLNPPLLHPVVRGLALLTVGCVILGSGYLFRKYIYRVEPTPTLVVNPPVPTPPNGKQSEKPKEPATQPEAKPIPAAKPPKRPSTIQTNPISTPLSGSQECAPGAECAQSNNQQGGITANKVIVNPPVNQNRRVLVYECNGTWRSYGPGENTGMEMNTCWPKCEKPKVFNELMELNNAKKYSELTVRCEQEIKTTPEWLTPYLFCGLANAGIGDLIKLRERLAYYDEHTGPAYDDVAQCKDMSDFLHNLLNSKQP